MASSFSALCFVNSAVMFWLWNLYENMPFFSSFISTFSSNSFAVFERSSLSRRFCHCQLYQFSFSMSKIAPALCTRSRENFSSSSFSERISFSSPAPGCQPRNATKFMIASRRYPFAM